MNGDKLGVILILVGMSFFCVQDIVIKDLSNQVSLLQILATRGLVGSLALALYLISSKQKIVIGSAYPKLALSRALFFFFGFLCFYVSLTTIKIAEATALFFISPFFMTIFSKLILKNQVGIFRILAILIGFTGSLMIVKPDFNQIEWAMLLPVLCAATYSLSMIFAKISSDQDSLFQQSFHIYLSSFVLGVLASCFLFFAGFDPAQGGLAEFILAPWVFDDAAILLKTILVAAIGSLGILCLIFAYRVGSPILNSPAEYILLVYSIGAGYLFFEEVPDVLSVLGILFITFSGILVVFREAANNQPVSIETNLRS